MNKGLRMLFWMMRPVVAAMGGILGSVQIELWVFWRLALRNQLPHQSYSSEWSKWGDMMILKIETYYSRLARANQRMKL